MKTDTDTTLYPEIRVRPHTANSEKVVIEITTSDWIGVDSDDTNLKPEKGEPIRIVLISKD